MKRLILLLALVLLPAQALAECAWIRWLKMIELASEGVPIHQRMQAYDTQASCESDAVASTADIKANTTKAGSRIISSGLTSILFQLEDGKTYLQAQDCWPDTVDPRK